MIHNEHSNRINQLEKTIQSVSTILQRTKNNSDKIGLLRLAAFFGSMIIAFALYPLVPTPVFIVVLFICAVLFGIVSMKQSKIIRLIEKYGKWIEIKISQLARAKLSWNEIPHHKLFQEEVSSLEIDLDLTGAHSLHQLLDFTKSTKASYLLREMLLSNPGSIEQILKRQSIVKELTKMSHFRDRFLLISHLSTKNEIEVSGFIKWLAVSDKETLLKKKYIFLSLMCAINGLGILLSIMNVIPSIWVVTTFLYWSVYLLNNKHIKYLSNEAEVIGAELRKIIAQIEFVEGYNFSSNVEVKTLCSPLKKNNVDAGALLRKINSILNIISFRANPVLWPLVITFGPVDYYLGYKVEIAKRELRNHLPDWLDVLSQLEVFISLANFSYLNPSYVFPQFEKREDDFGQISFEAKSLGHPLIHQEKKVTNHYSLKGSGIVHIVTGSNMSGKSTFLRTVGINICLAYSGAPVNAEFLKMNLVRLFSCIKVSDSVTDGISYFYAEVKRLKQLLGLFDEQSHVPVLFLVDEIFKGTNNLERLKGSQSIIKALVQKNGSGLISTHDLELIKLADEVDTVSNYHFKEEILDDKMVFDYKLYNGPCPTTNAIKIMRSSGLPIPD